METVREGNRNRFGLSDQVRSVALKKHLEPAMRAGKTRISVAVKDLMNDLRQNDFPQRNWHQVCSAIQTEKFLRSNGLEIEAVDGPPSRTSSTVVVHYRVTGVPDLKVESQSPQSESAPSDETPEEWAHRMTGKLFGLMKEEIAAFGGGEAFLKWVRSEEKEDAA
ncbi:MAG TPA: hypothetical protein VGS10_21300 [Terracidiphilus sp.]|nr:hypothetical protein [Terracidiphilus sp.]